MAKWGQGDPRWIVEERPDATNVNNWHWSDKNASGWSVDKLKALLVGLVVESKEGKCSTVEVPSCKGEATVNNRKGKLIFFYEWHIKIKWKGKVSAASNSSSVDPVDSDDSDDSNDGSDGKEYIGEIEIPNFSEENDMDDVDVIVTAKKTTNEAHKLKEMMHREAGGVVKKQLLEYLRCLKEEYSKDLILPRRDSSPAQLNKQASIPQNTQNSLTTSSSDKPAARASGSPIGCRIYTAKITLTESFMAEIDDLYNALTDQKLVEAFTQTKAVVEAHKGGSYSIMDGQIRGEFVECIRPSKIVQKWRLKSWPDGHYSTVTIELRQTFNSAELELHQTEVPESECEKTRDGWKRFIFQRIKHTFGYGAQLF